MNAPWGWGSVKVYLDPNGDYAYYDGDIHIGGLDTTKALDTAQHEYGHYVMDMAGRFPSTGDCPSPHYLVYVSGWTCGWTEGWADYFPLVAQSFMNNQGLQDPVYEWGNGAWLNLEWPTWASPMYWSNGPRVEGRVAGALWDFYDYWNDGYDTFTDGPWDIWETFMFATYTSFSDFWWTGWMYGLGHNQEQNGAVGALYQNTIQFWPLFHYDRISGLAAADTAGIAALRSWGPWDPYGGYVHTVYLAHLGGLDYYEEFHVVDALAAGSSVGNTWVNRPYEGAVLLVPGNLDAPWKQAQVDSTINYIYYLWPDNVVILGGTGSISAQVEQYVKVKLGPGYAYGRISGVNAADTAGLLAMTAYPSGSDFVYIGHLGGPNAEDEFHIVDALSAGGSVGNQYPLLLAPGNLDADWKKTTIDTTITYLNILGAKNVVLIGGTGSISTEVENYLRAHYPGAGYSRVSGTNAADTAGQLALRYYGTWSSVVYLAHLGGLTIGEEFHVVDALAAGSSLGNNGAILPVPGNLDAPWKQAQLDTTISYLNTLHAAQIIFLGGTGSISAEVEQYVRNHYVPYGAPELPTPSPVGPGLGGSGNESSTLSSFSIETSAISCRWATPVARSI
jgi:hypothetical protein